jgi:hypothetical protein
MAFYKILHAAHRSYVFPVVRNITSQIEYKPGREQKLDGNCFNSCQLSARLSSRFSFQNHTTTTPESEVDAVALIF